MPIQRDQVRAVPRLSARQATQASTAAPTGRPVYPMPLHPLDDYTAAQGRRLPEGMPSNRRLRAGCSAVGDSR
jgi:hypothetical protein